MTSYIRLTAKIRGAILRPKVTHYRGLPQDLGGGLHKKMGVAASVTIEEKADGVFLYRLAADGQIVGDTWHMSIEEAQQQACYEFGDLLDNWQTESKQEEDP